jgi:hypothetical protein
VASLCDLVIGSGEVGIAIFLPEFKNSLFLSDPANFRAGYRKKDDFDDGNVRDEILVRLTFGYLTTWQRLPQSCEVESAGENVCTWNESRN